MRLAKYQMPSGEIGVGQLDDDHLLPLDLSGGHYAKLSDILEAENPLELADFLLRRHEAVAVAKVRLLAPIDQQEVWAVGIPASLRRFSMLQCYDNVRPKRLPPLLQDKNPTGRL